MGCTVCVGCGGEGLQGQMGEDKCRNTLTHGCIQPATPVRGCYIAIYHGIMVTQRSQDYTRLSGGQSDCK